MLKPWNCHEKRTEHEQRCAVLSQRIETELIKRLSTMHVSKVSSLRVENYAELRFLA